MAITDIDTGGNNSTVVTFKVNANGNALPTTYGIHSIAVNKEANRIASAMLVIADGDPASQDFSISDTGDLIPGNTIEIQAGFNGNSNSIFKGIIIKHSIKIRRSNSFLIIECRDQAIQMTTVKNYQYFSQVTDSDAMQQIIGNYSNITANVSSTSTQHEELVQYNCADWDFILSRADANAMLCFNENGQITISKPNFAGSSSFTATFGNNILEFDADIDNRVQPTGVTATSWDYSNQGLVSGVEANDPGATTPGNLAASDLASEVANSEFQLSHSGYIPQDELQSWADSKLLRCRLAKVRGRVTVTGTSNLSLGGIFTLAGVGDRFNGNAYITGIRHTIEDGAWYTTLQFGINPEWFAFNYDIKTNDAETLMPGVRGLHIGVVTQLENDPNGENRIQVRIPIINNNDNGVWSRIALLDAGNNRGTFFLPEINDEVIVGFINNDPRQSVVLGMLNSSANPAPLTASNQNDQKGYVSRSGIQLLFDDGKVVVSLQTPNGNQTTWDDNNQQIVVQDQNNNQITMNQQGISIQDTNNNQLTMDNSGISIQSQNDITLQAQGNVNISGVNISVSANSQFQAQGQSGAQVSSSGNMVIQGSMVQIN
jgi:Rhs element Vgr protein